MRAARAAYVSWDDAKKAQLSRLWLLGRTAAEIADEMGLQTRNQVIGMVRRLDLIGKPRAHREGGRGHARDPESGPKRDTTGLSRFAARKPRKWGARRLKDDNPAVVEGRTTHPNMRRHPQDVLRVLKSGENSSKIGRKILKGRWKGYTVWTLTLEERATCPRTCTEWKTCYGANMQYAQRIMHGPALEGALWHDLEALQAKYPRGFTVRLHVLGDFYSLDYVDFWAAALDAFPALHIFGFTARRPGTEIGDALFDLSRLTWDRFAIRFSGAGLTEMGSEVVDSADQAKSLICPVQTEKTQHCGTCGFCWQSRANITFIRH